MSPSGLKLKLYVDHIAQWRGSDQLFVCIGAKNKGTAITKQRMFHWIVEAISMEYEMRGLTLPLGVRAHSTRAMASSQALFKGQSILQPSASVQSALRNFVIRRIRGQPHTPSVCRQFFETAQMVRVQQRMREVNVETERKLSRWYCACVELIRPHSSVVEYTLKVVWTWLCARWNGTRKVKYTWALRGLRRKIFVLRQDGPLLALSLSTTVWM